MTKLETVQDLFHAVAEINQRLAAIEQFMPAISKALGGEILPGTVRPVHADVGIDDSNTGVYNGNLSDEQRAAALGITLERFAELKAQVKAELDNA